LPAARRPGQVVEVAGERLLFEGQVTVAEDRLQIEW